MLSEDPNLFFYSNEWQYNRTENLDRNYTVGIDTFFRLTQLLAIRDAIVRPLLGWATNISKFILSRSRVAQFRNSYDIRIDRIQLGAHIVLDTCYSYLSTDHTTIQTPTVKG